jgi:hypothetical protein
VAAVAAVDEATEAMDVAVEILDELADDVAPGPGPAPTAAAALVECGKGVPIAKAEFVALDAMLVAAVMVADGVFTAADGALRDGNTLEPEAAREPAGKSVPIGADGFATSPMLCWSNTSHVKVETQ